MAGDVVENNLVSRRSRDSGNEFDSHNVYATSVEEGMISCRLAKQTEIYRQMYRLFSCSQREVLPSVALSIFCCQRTRLVIQDQKQAHQSSQAGRRLSISEQEQVSRSAPGHEQNYDEPVANCISPGGEVN